MITRKDMVTLNIFTVLGNHILLFCADFLVVELHQEFCINADQAVIDFRFLIEEENYFPVLSLAKLFNEQV